MIRAPASVRTGPPNGGRLGTRTGSLGGGRLCGGQAIRVGPQPDWSGSSSIHAHAIPRQFCRHKTGSSVGNPKRANDKTPLTCRSGTVPRVWFPC